MSITFSVPIKVADDYTGIKVEIKPEKWRCIAYSFFWTMVMLAETLSRWYAADILAAGPPPGTPTEKLGCGPFNRENKNGFGVGIGQGFDIYTQSHLQEDFGFPNVCTSWDYTPSREITGMYFPLFEYSLVIYLLLDYLNTRISYKRGELPGWFMGFSNVVFTLSVILCILFRMIFIYIAYEDTAKHTVAFLGLQIALILVAFQNTFYVIMTGQSYPTLGMSKGGTKCFAWTYLIGLVAISAFKIWGTIYIVTEGTGSPLYKTPVDFWPGKLWGQMIDYVWMLFNAIIPFFIALVRSRNETPLTFEVTCPKPNYEGGDSEGDSVGETTSLL